MSEETTIPRKNRALLKDQTSNDYAATEELNFDDFEELAKSVLRQRKISSVVSNHLRPQFSELDKVDKEKLFQKKQIKSTDQEPSFYQTSAQSNTEISIDSDVFDSIVIGLTQLVNNQLRFADEFGLKQEVVFSTDVKDMKNLGSSTVIHEWLKGNQTNASSKLDMLFEDLANHQNGILASLDTISRRTIKYLGPELTKKSVHGFAKFGPMGPHYKKRNNKLSADQRTRYKIIISPGVAYGYEKAKRKYTTKK